MLTVNYCGYHRINRDYDRIFRPHGSGDYLFLLFLSPMTVRINNHEYLAESGACLLYTPDFPQDYNAVERFQNNYVHFSSDNAFFHKYNIPVNCIFYPQNRDEINHILKDIYMEYLSKNIFYEEKNQLLLQSLFISLGRERLQTSLPPQEDDGLYSRFEKFRFQMLVNCQQEWDIERMCKEVSMAKSQFYFYYHRFFHTTPKAELIRARIELARNLLTNQAMQIQQVALLCGFQNVYHFTRYFKKMCGLSPGQYIKKQKNT